MSRKTRSVLIIFFAGAILYFFLFPVPLGTELLIRPVWSFELSSAGVHPGTTDAGDPVLGFSLGKRIAFFSESGKPGFSEEIMYDAAVSDSMFVNYSRIPETLLVRDASGRTLLEVPEHGYPLLRNGRLFILDPDRSGISEWSFSGTLLWKKNFVSLITNLVVTDETSLVGLLDGTALLLDHAGTELSSFSPSGSRIPAVYGCAVSPDGNSVAFVSGVDPQRFTLYSRKPEHFKPVFQSDLESDFRRKVFLEFSSNGDFLYFEDAEGISILETSGGRVDAIPLRGRISKLVPAFRDSMFVLSRSSDSEGGQRTDISLLLPERKTVMDLSWAGGLTILRMEKHSLYTGNDAVVMRIDMVNG